MAIAFRGEPGHQGLTVHQRRRNRAADAVEAFPNVLRLLLKPSPTFFGESPANIACNAIWRWSFNDSGVAPVSPPKMKDGKKPPAITPPPL